MVSALSWRLAVTLLACIGTVWTVAQALSLDVTRSGAGTAAAPRASPAADAAPAGPVDIEALAGWQLFGDPRRADPAQPVATAPVTALQVTLQGVIAATDGSASEAILSVGGQQRRYAAGDTLPLDGRVRLLATASDFVLLDNAGRRETLWLYPPVPTAGSPASEPRAVTAELPPVPETASTEVVQLAEHRVAGALRGYRLQPGRDRDRFKRLGMESGDLLKAFDSIGLDQPEAAEALFTALRDRRDLHLLIQRDRQELTLLIAGSAI